MRSEICHPDFDTPVTRKWLRSRPPAVLRLACEFPLGMRLFLENGTLVIIGYSLANSHKQPMIQAVPVERLGFIADGTPAFDLEDTRWFPAESLRKTRRVAVHEEVTDRDQ